MKTNNIWNAPIIENGLLVEISPVDWQTLTALAACIDEQGMCRPSLKNLCAVLGLADIASVSKRLSKLEKKTFEGLPVVTIKRGKKRNNKGVWVYSTNEYQLHPAILTIFSPSLAGKSRQTRAGD